MALWRRSIRFIGSMVAMSQITAMADESWTPSLMMQVKRIGSVQVSPDGRWAAFAVRSAVMSDTASEFVTHIHLATTEGRESRQLTQGDASCDDPQWSPDGRWIAFLSSRSGKKNLWLISPDGGEAQPLTDIPMDISSFKWSPDGRSLAFTALDAAGDEEEAARKAKRDVRLIDQNIKRQRLYVVPVTWPHAVQRSPRRVTPDDWSVGGDLFRSVQPPFDWSPDGAEIVVSHSFSPRPNDWTTADLSVVSVASGEARKLATTAAAETSPFFSPDGRQIAFVTSDDPPTWAGRKRIAVVPSTGGTPRLLPETFDHFGRYSELIGWSADGTRLYVTEAHRTRLRILALPLEGEANELELSPGMSSGGVFLNGRRTHLGFSWETLNTPPEAVVGELNSWKPTRVSRVQSAVLASESEYAVQPRPPKTDVIRWTSTEGFEIEGLLTYPKGYVAGKRYPLLVVIHGGPMGVFMQSFDGSPGTYPIATFADRGYAVLRPNVRGSSGYGSPFRYANYRDWGGGDYRDVMAGVDHVIQSGLADPDRLGVMGWSYGGYMTAWIITQTDRFRAASVGAGVTNLVSFTGTADIPGFLPDYFRGEFWDDAETYQKRSPIFHVKGTRTPTLIQHGEKDERVPLSQGQELYNALKRQGCETEMVVYPRTPHAVEEPKFMLDCMERNLAWFERHLGR